MRRLKSISYTPALPYYLHPCRHPRGRGGVLEIPCCVSSFKAHIQLKLTTSCFQQFHHFVTTNNLFFQ